MELGEKIKLMRKDRGLTQAQLAGDRITRNMLCEIEKGKATPSLDTLCYIAKELEVPPSYLLDESENPVGYFKRRTMPRIRELYQEGRFGECFRLCETLPETPDDEISFLMAHCALAEGKRAFHSGNMETALVYFSEALSYAKRTFFPTESLRASATLYSAIAGNVGSPRREFDEEAYRTLSTNATDAELYAYMTDSADFPYENSLYAAHQRARSLMHERRRSDALAILHSLEERKGEEGVSAYFLFRLYSDLEICYREGRDFERAYKYSSKRMALLSAFQS